MLAAQHFPPLDEWDEAAWPTPHTIAVFPIWTDVSDWGLLALALPSDIDFPAFTSLWLWFGLLGVGLDYYSARKTLLQQQEDLKQSYSRERVLSETIRELGAPVIQLSSRAVLVPLVGAIDSERAMHITDRVLATVHTLNARTVVLDLSGVPIVDTQVAAALMSLAKSVSLLGSSVAIVGVRPEIAQSIVGLGIDFRSFATYASLSNALSALRN
jgi:anti-anti-sigma regulatory factor